MFRAAHAAARDRSSAAPARPSFPTAQQERTRKSREDSSFLPKPQRNREPVRDSRVPYVQVLLTIEIAAVTRDQPQVVLEVVIETGVETRVVDGRQPIPAAVKRKYLLDAPHELRLLDRGVRRHMVKLVCGLQPIPPAVVVRVVLGFQVQRRLQRLPGNVC